jgi:hypothetical protein
MARRKGQTLLPHHRGVSPAEPAQQEQVLRWLEAFVASPAHLVLDVAGAINIECHHKLDFDGYGIEVVMAKLYRDEIGRVQLEYDRDGADILPQPLEVLVHDLADRKMVAAALQALALPGTTGRASLPVPVSLCCH